MLSLEDMVYTACALDAEGQIRIARYKQKKELLNKRGLKTPEQLSLILS